MNSYRACRRLGCHEPPIEDAIIIRIFADFLNSERLHKPKWTCTKCSRKKPIAPPLPVPEPEILVIESSQPSSSTRRVSGTRPNRRSEVSEVIDLTESPEVRRPARPRASRPSVAEIIDIEESEDPPPSVSVSPSPSDSRPRVQSPRARTETIILSGPPRFIDLSLDSPPSVPLNLPAPPAAAVRLSPMEACGSRAPASGSLTPSEPRSPTPVAPVGPHSTLPDSHRLRTPPGPSPSRSPAPRDTPTPTPTATRLPSPSRDMDMDMDMNMNDDEEIDQKPLLFTTDDDEIEQKPLALLLQNMTVSDRPRGGTLGPAWMRERFAASGEMAKWERFAERQKMPKPLSRRKPAKTRFGGGAGKSFVVLPFDGNAQE
ncbi:hypothetical protein DFH08DRAFT_962497 [Mycena albidolilacea]|uniref:Uncharacterized protein n=1 Tax=Mycena albidolilacea TaxID=1033008 RepID=A0AAD6ZX85_9AGAR|nr:hypothetical protein DFH08DRAFT_962497 [Mycena albidolilacea]